jgi:hypothetical protein
MYAPYLPYYRMKKILFILIPILVLSSSVLKGQAALLVLIFGEKAATENFHFSMKLGLNYSIIHGYEEGTNGVNLNFGVVNNIRLNDRLSLIAEFIPLSARSVKNLPVLTTGNPELDDLLVDVESTDRKLSYLDIPVLLKIKLSQRFSISAGPQISIRTGATDTYSSSPLEGTVLSTEIDIKSYIRAIDAGGVIDLHYILVHPKGGKGINLFLRYGKGFVPLLKDTDGPRYTTSVIQVGATFPFVQKEQLSD